MVIDNLLHVHVYVHIFQFEQNFKTWNVMPWLQVGLFVNIVFVCVIEAERDYMYIICPVDKRKK